MKWVCRLSSIIRLRSHRPFAHGLNSSQALSQIELDEQKEAQEEKKKAKKIARQAHGTGKKGCKARKMSNTSRRVHLEKKTKEVAQAKREAEDKKQREAAKKSV